MTSDISENIRPGATGAGALPNFVIIGAMRAGTSSLHHFLKQHPDFFLSTPKELNFFLDNFNWNKGIEWYRNHFVTALKFRGEASPNYTKWKGTAEKMHSMIPDIKLIYIVRNPTKRFESHCNYSQKDPHEVVAKAGMKRDTLPEEFINGLYFQHISDYLHFFNRNQILFLSTDDLYDNPKAALQRVFKFLEADAGKVEWDSIKLSPQHEISADYVSPNWFVKLKFMRHFQVIKNAGKSMLGSLYFILKDGFRNVFFSRKKIMKLSSEDRQFLNDYYEEDRKRFLELSGIDTLSLKS